jgi:hypothetical protein
MLCEGCFIFGETDDQKIIFYIHRSGRPHKNILDPGAASYLENNTVAYVIAYTVKDILSIESLYAKEKGTRQGTVVLKALCYFVEKHFPNIKNVDLDDSTGIDPPRNIYYRLGFKVRDEKTHAYIKWDTWLGRYKHLSNPSEERRISLSTLLKNLDKLY